MFVLCAVRRAVRPAANLARDTGRGSKCEGRGMIRVKVKCKAIKMPQNVPSGSSCAGMQQSCAAHRIVRKSQSVRPSFTLLPEIAPFTTSVHSGALQNDQHGGERMFILCPRRFGLQHRCARSCTVIGVCVCVCVCVCVKRGGGDGWYRTAAEWFFVSGITSVSHHAAFLYLAPQLKMQYLCSAD